MVQATPLIEFVLGDKDPQTKEVRKRHLRITFGTLMLLENDGKRSIMDRSTWENLEVPEIASFIAAALKHEDNSITPKYVGKFLGPHNLKYLFNVLAMAWNASQTGQPDYRPLEVLAVAA